LGDQKSIDSTVKQISLQQQKNFACISDQTNNGPLNQKLK